MNSEPTDDFLACFRRLPERIRRQARKNYRIWKTDPQHPGIDFKRVGKRSTVYSVRVSLAAVMPAGANTTLTTLVSFDGTNGGGPYAGLIADAAGNLYGTTHFNGN